MDDEELTLDELLDIIAVLTHIRTIFPIAHQEQHWTMPVTARLERQLVRRRAAGEKTNKEREQERPITRRRRKRE